MKRRSSICRFACFALSLIRLKRSDFAIYFMCDRDLSDRLCVQSRTLPLDNAARYDAPIHAHSSRTEAHWTLCMSCYDHIYPGLIPGFPFTELVAVNARVI